MNLHAVSRLLVAIPVAAVLPFGSAIAADGADEMKEITFDTADGVTIDATLFPANSKDAVIFAHGAVFDKTTWYDQCEKLQARNVNALTINFRGYGKSDAGDRSGLHQDILGAIRYCSSNGLMRISVVGGSMGGMAILNALAEPDAPTVYKAVLLAPAGGKPLQSPDTDKLFICAEGDRLVERVKSLYRDSAVPKHVEIVPGDAHAQHLFKTEHAAAVTQTIVEFLTKPDEK